MLLFPSDITEKTPMIGAKTKNLVRLMKFGFQVPEFVAIAANTVSAVDGNKTLLKELCREIEKNFPKNAYAVRSSALIEDQAASSLAGQFHTELKVSPPDLEKAILRVITQAKAYLNGDLREFSLLIQRHIEADISGVCFTRNPAGKREMIVEYNRGMGEKLVAGAIKPQRLACYWSEAISDSPVVIGIFQAIEKQFGFPQDIEWCTHADQLFILQSRPITTISRSNYEEIVFLEKALPVKTKQDFFYEKTAISEMAPRPTPFTLSLLDEIFSINGPIANAYEKHSIEYIPYPQRKILGNELYIDREQELKTLLPSMSIINSRYVPRFFTFKGIYRTIKNIIFIIWLKDNNNIRESIKNACDSNKHPSGFSEALQQFLKDYEMIFEINLLAIKYLQRAELLLRKEGIETSELLSSKGLFLNKEGLPSISQDLTTTLCGNTLEIADESVFLALEGRNSDTGKFSSWWQKLPVWKKKLYFLPLQDAVSYEWLCECARVLMIKNLNNLRIELLKTSPLKLKKLAYFQTIAEIKKNKWNEELCLKRKREYEKYHGLTLPSKLTGHMTAEKTRNTGISPGIARGKVVDKIDEQEDQYSKILYTKILSPDIATHLSAFTGIISETGGMLSHMAIIAREQKIPVVGVGENHDIQLGDFVEINGASGEIKKITPDAIDYPSNLNKQ